MEVSYLSSKQFLLRKALRCMFSDIFATGKMGKIYKECIKKGTMGNATLSDKLIK